MGSRDRRSRIDIKGVQDENTGEQRDTCTKRETQTCVRLQVLVCTACARDSHDDDDDDDDNDDD